MTFVRESVKVGDKELTIESGRMAKQASGSAIVQVGDSVVLVTSVGSKGPRDLPFMPLTCEYQERFYAAGKIPGSFFRREGRPSEADILVCRLMDRPCRPLFPDGWRFDTQIIANVISYDKSNPTDVLAVTGSSASLHLSDLVWNGPLAGMRVARIDGKFVALPTFEEREASDIDLVVAATRDAIVMVEGGMKEVQESVLIDALLFAHDSCQPIIDLQEKLRAAVGKPKREFTEPVLDDAILTNVRELAWDRIGSAMGIRDKHQRYDTLSTIGTEVMEKLAAEGAPFEGRREEVGEAYASLKKKLAREQTLKTRVRIDGRKPDEIRNIDCQVGLLPKTHGSALFQRGETQSLVTATMGMKFDEKRLDTLLGDQRKTFFLHYNFPPFCTGEAKPIRSTSRREIGHGNLAERSVAQVMPVHEDFPYTVRVVSEILESNGSSSMASVCGGSLALMDAGVPTTGAVAGIAMGLMKEGDDYAILSDILGDEDHMGDMDFKVTGTRKGVCALQMDIKLDGLDRSILEEALEQARQGRLHILDKMAEAIAEPRDELSPNAPRILTLQVKPDRIRDIIGPGGKTIRAITEQTGAKIDVSDDGRVSIASNDGKALQQAIDFINGLTMEPEVGQVYTGVVRRVVDFGAFVEIMPGTDGLVHISELSEERTRKVTDVINEGDEVVVKCINIDRDGKIRLSRKEAADAPADQVQNFLLSN